MRGGAVTLSVVLLVTVSVVAAGAPVVADHTGGHFLWEAPPSATGTLVTQLTFTFGAPSQCSWRMAAAGIVDDPVVFWATGPAGFSLSANALLQVHAGALVDTRDVLTTDGNWASKVTFGGTFQGTQTWTVASFGTQLWPNRVTDVPFALEMTCDGPFVVSDLGGSQEGTSFREWSMDGAGASVDTRAAAQVFDETGFDIRSAGGILDLLVISGAQAGVVTVDTPAGSEDHVVAGPSVIDVTETAGAGTYSVTATRLSVDLFHIFVGVIVGVDPVGSLDEIVA